MTQPISRSSKSGNTASSRDEPVKQVFVAYAREDEAQKNELVHHLENRQIQCRGDWELEAGRFFREELLAFMRRSDAVVFLLSPDSVSSAECLDELASAARLKKKLIPVCLKEPDTNLPQELSEPQWVRADSGSEAQSAVDIENAVKTDFELAHLHAVLTDGADAFARGRRESLRGKELKAAISWLKKVEKEPDSLPNTTEEISTFIKTSRRAHSRRVIFSTLSIVAVIVIVGLLMFAWDEAELRAVAEEQKKRVAEAGRTRERALKVAFSARELLAQERAETAAVLAREGLRLEGTVEADSALRDAIARIPRLERTLLQGVEIEHLEFSADGSLLLGVDTNGALYAWRTEDWALVSFNEQFAGLDHTRVMTDGSGIVGVDSDGTIVVVSTIQADSKRIPSGLPRLAGLLLAPDASSVALWGGDNRRTLRVVSLLGGPIRSLMTDESIQSVAYDTTGKQLVVADGTASVRLMNLVSGKVSALEPEQPRGEKRTERDPLRFEWAQFLDSHCVIAASYGAHDGFMAHQWELESPLNTDLAWCPHGSDPRNPLTCADSCATLSALPSIDYAFNTPASISRGEMPQRFGFSIAQARTGLCVLQHRPLPFLPIIDIPFYGEPKLALRDNVPLVFVRENQSIRIFEARMSALEPLHASGSGPRPVSRFTYDGPVEKTEAHTYEPITAWNVTPDGRFLVVALRDLLADSPDPASPHFLRVFNVEPYLGPRSVVQDSLCNENVYGSCDFYTAAVNSKGWLAVGNGEGVVWLGRGREENPGELIELGTERIAALRFSQNGKMLAGASGSELYVVRLEADKVVSRLRGTHDGDIKAVEFSADGMRLASAARDNTARVWDLKSDTEPIILKHNDETNQAVNAVHFCPGLDIVVTAGGDGIARAWGLPDGKRLTEFAHEDDVVDVACSVQGLLASASRDGSFTVSQIAGPEKVKINVGELVNAVDFSRDGRLLAVGTGDHGGIRGTTIHPGHVIIWDTERKAEVGRLVHPEPVHDVEILSEGRFLASLTIGLPGTQYRVYRIWNIAEQRELVRVQSPSWATRLHDEPKGRYVALARGLLVWRTEDVIETYGRYAPRHPTRNEWANYFAPAPYPYACTDKE